MKLVSILASNPQANCHLKPQQATRGLNSLHWEENKPQQRAKLPRESPGSGPEPGREGKAGRGGGSRGPQSEQSGGYHRVRGQGTGVWGGGTGRAWGPGRRVAEQLQRKPFPEKAGSPSLIEKKASWGGGGSRWGSPPISRKLRLQQDNLGKGRGPASRACRGQLQGGGACNKWAPEAGNAEAGRARGTPG